MDMNLVVRASQEAIARGNRTSHPRGKFDKQRRWWPDDEESRDCCLKEIKKFNNKRTAKYPYPILDHCRSPEHVSTLYGTDLDWMRVGIVLIRRGFNIEVVEQALSASFARERLTNIEASLSAVEKMAKLIASGG